jgi:hypothetical protein
MGPMPLYDVTGYSLAVQILLASMEAEKYHADHSQYKTIHKHCLAFSNCLFALEKGSRVNILTGQDQRGQLILLTTCPIDLEWVFKHFYKGLKKQMGALKKQMGQDVQSQLGFSLRVMQEMMKRLE